MAGATPTSSDAGTMRPPHRGACAALLGSAVVHATVVGEHLQEWPPAGVFFLVLIAVECALAVAVFRGGRRTAQAVVLTGVATVAVWALSRTVGLPLGPADFRVPEGVGAPDLACCALELLAAALALPTALGRDGVTTRWSSTTARAVAASTVTLALSLTVWGLAPAYSTADRAATTHAHHG